MYLQLLYGWLVGMHSSEAALASSSCLSTDLDRPEKYWHAPAIGHPWTHRLQQTAGCPSGAVHITCIEGETLEKKKTKHATKTCCRGPWANLICWGPSCRCGPGGNKSHHNTLPPSPQITSSCHDNRYDSQPGVARHLLPVLSRSG